MPRQTLTVQLMHANARIAKLEEQLLDVTSAYSALSTKYDAISAQRPAAQLLSTKPTPEQFEGYWDYVRAVKKWCFANNRPVSYLTQQDWANHFEHA